MKPDNARLLHRGESFEVILAGKKYQGACIWSWEDRPDPSSPISLANMPERVYPLIILARSINKTGIHSLFPIAKRRQLEIAKAAVALLQAREPTAAYQIVED